MIFVKRILHFRGFIGDVLKTRAVHRNPISWMWGGRGRVSAGAGRRTFLEDGCPVHLEDSLLSIFVLLGVAHAEKCGRDSREVEGGLWERWVGCCCWNWSTLLVRRSRLSGGRGVGFELGYCKAPRCALNANHLTK